MKKHNYTITIDRRDLRGSWYTDMRKTAEEYGVIVRETRTYLTLNVQETALSLHHTLIELEAWDADISSVKEQ